MCQGVARCQPPFHLRGHPGKELLGAMAAGSMQATSLLQVVPSLTGGESTTGTIIPDKSGRENGLHVGSPRSRDLQ